MKKHDIVVGICVVAVLSIAFCIAVLSRVEAKPVAPVQIMWNSPSPGWGGDNVTTIDISDVPTLQPFWITFTKDGTTYYIPRENIISIKIKN
jgi:hypothetical protein